MPDSPTPQRTRPADSALNTGFGRVLLFVYALGALSASARGLVQVFTHFGEAPLAYLLSAFAGLIYLVATVGLAMGGERGRRIALVSCSIELVGTWSLADKATFPDATVWSGYGSGYGYVPLILPFVGLWWIWRHRPRPERDADET